MTDTNGPDDKAPSSEANVQDNTAQPPRDPLLEAQREAVELKDKLLRTLAEMENLRRRTEREVADARTYGIANFRARRRDRRRQYGARAAGAGQ